MTTETLNKQEQFFYDNGSFSYQPATQTPEQGHIESAKALANAESLAIERGWSFAWEYDEDGCIGCECGSIECSCFTREDHEVLCCLLYGEYEIDEGARWPMASLGSICEPSNENRRVIEAELALEALS